MDTDAPPYMLHLWRSIGYEMTEANVQGGAAPTPTIGHFNTAGITQYRLAAALP